MKEIMVIGSKRHAVKELGEALMDDYELTFAESPQVAVDAMEQKKPNAVIINQTDYSRVHMEVVMVIRSRFGKSLPIIVLSANGRIMDIEECIKSGVDSYIVKPIRHDHILEKIEDLMEKVEIRSKMTREQKLEILNAVTA